MDKQERGINCTISTTNDKLILRVKLNSFFFPLKAFVYIMSSRQIWNFSWKVSISHTRNVQWVTIEDKISHWLFLFLDNLVMNVWFLITKMPSSINTANFANHPIQIPNDFPAILKAYTKVRASLTRSVY